MFMSCGQWGVLVTAAQVPGVQWRWKVALDLGAASHWGKLACKASALAVGQLFSKAVANPS